MKQITINYNSTYYQRCYCMNLAIDLQKSLNCSYKVWKYNALTASNTAFGFPYRCFIDFDIFECFVIVFYSWKSYLCFSYIDSAK